MQYFGFGCTPMQVIPETRCVHSIWFSICITTHVLLLSLVIGNEDQNSAQWFCVHCSAQGICVRSSAKGFCDREKNLQHVFYNGEHSPIFPPGGVAVPTVVRKTFVFR